MAPPRMMIGKLIKGLNYKYKCHIVVNFSHYFKDDRKITLYTAAETYVDPEEGFITKVLYKSNSPINIVIFLRNLLYAFRGEDYPDDNEYYRRSRNYESAKANIQYMVQKYGNRQDKE